MVCDCPGALSLQDISETPHLGGILSFDFILSVTTQRLWPWMGAGAKWQLCFYSELSFFYLNRPVSPSLQMPLSISWSTLPSVMSKTPRCSNSFTWGSSSAPTQCADVPKLRGVDFHPCCFTLGCKRPTGCWALCRVHISAQLFEQDKLLLAQRFAKKTWLGFRSSGLFFPITPLQVILSSST